jgi:hypothetical protein
MTRDPGYDQIIDQWLYDVAPLDSLPFGWQVVLRSALNRELQELGLLSDRLDYLQSEINARRAEIRRMLLDEQPPPAALSPSELRKLAADRARVAASRPVDVSSENRHQPKMLNEVVEELLRDGGGVPPRLEQVNRALRAAGEHRATQAQIDRAIARFSYHRRSRDADEGAPRRQRPRRA